MSKCNVIPINNPCPSYPDTKCVVYSGVNLINLGVNSNERLQSILQKIDAAIGASVTATLASLTDVHFTLPLIDNQFLQYSLSENKWVNSTINYQPFIDAGTTLQYWRGDKTFQTLDTSVVPENGFLYYTNARSRAAISLTTVGTSGVSTYNSSTGILNIPNYASGTTANSILWNGYANNFAAGIQDTITGVNLTDGILGMAEDFVVYRFNAAAIAQYLGLGTAAYSNTGDFEVPLTFSTGLLRIGNTITNSAPDQTVVLNSGTGISVTGVYPNFTIASTINTMVYPTVGIPYSTGTAWGTSYTSTGSGTVIALQTGASLYNPVINNYLDFGNGAGTTLAAGRMWYNNTTGSWNLGMGGGDITQQIGEELFWYGKASSAINDSPLQIIYQTGTVGSSGVIRFAPTIAGITDGDDIIGIATEPISTNGFGRITTFGIVNNITTNGSAYGETWADGDMIWYNPVTGNPTNVKPSAPNIKVSVGRIIKAGSGNSGSFAVEIAHGSIFGGTDANVQFNTINTGDLIRYNGTYWSNVAQIPNSNLINSSITIQGNSVSLGGSVNIINGTGFVKASGTTISYDNSTYLTTISGIAAGGELTGTYANPSLLTSAVTSKLLTGLNLVPGGSISATDSILSAFGKVQNQISALVGGVIYQGVWNASTNTPTITSSIGTKGWYYVVNVAGNTNIDGITDWKVGDWVIFNGSTWDKVDNTDAVSSVNGFTGAVSLTTFNIPEVTNLYYLDSRARAALSFIAGSGAYNNTTGVITIPTNTNQLTNGASFITLASLSASSPLSYNNTTGVFSISQATTSTNGYLSSTDWNTFNNKQNALTNPITGTGTVNTIAKFTGSTTLGNSIITESGSRIRVNGNGIEINGPATSYKELLFLTDLGARFNAYVIGAETGSNAGSNYYFSRYDDAGAYIDDVYSVDRATGNVSFNYDISTNTKITTPNTISTQYNFATGTAFASYGSGHTYVYSGTTDFIVTSNTGAATLFSVSNTGTGNLAGALTTLGLTVNTGATVLNSLSGGSAGNFVVSNSGTLVTRTAAQVLSDIGAAPATGGAYLPLTAGIGSPLTGTLFGVASSWTGDAAYGYNNAVTFGSFPYRFKIARDSAGDLPVYFDDEYDNALSSINFRMRTTGTLFTPLVIKYNNVNTARLNVNGATDNPSYALNVTGAGNFSGSVSGTSAAFSSTGLFTNVTTTQGTNPYFQWTNTIGTRLSYIQHNAVNLIYNADVGSHVFNQAILAASTITTGAAGVYVYSSATRMESDGTNLYLRATGNTYLNTANTAYSDNGGVVYGNGFSVPNGGYYKAIRTSGLASINVLGIEAGTDNTVMVASNYFKLRNTGTGDAANTFTVDSSGNTVTKNDATINGIIYAYRAASNTLLTGGSIYFSGGYSALRIGTDNSWNIDNYNGGTYINALKISQNGTMTIPNLVGTGDRMVVANSSGVLSTQVIPSGTASSGTYTPTITNYSNTSGLSSGTAQWIRIGNIVTVSFFVAGTCTANAQNSFKISLPVGAAFTSVDQGYGSAVSDQSSYGGAPIGFEISSDGVFGPSANMIATCRVPTGQTTFSCKGMFQYEVQ